MTKWSIISAVLQPGVSDDQERLASLLGEGWEPFAADYIAITGSFIYHLRKAEG